jgi:polyhydroxybutyrate depolymerase
MNHSSKLTFTTLAALALAIGCGSSSDGGARAPAEPPVGSKPIEAAPAAPPSSTDPNQTPLQTCSGKVAQPVDDVWTITSKGKSRTARVHVPRAYDPTHQTPVVLDFHGLGSDAAQQELLSFMSAKADKEGFIAVYPQGLDASWNAGACCGQSASSGVDDVGFVSDLLDALEARLCVNTKRVFATGMSNGGFLSHRLGCELSTRIAAIAPVAGVLGVATCNPSRPVPIVHFHGTADTLVPYEGSPTLGFPPVEDTFAKWGARDGCTGTPVETYRKGDAHCSKYPSCAGSAEVTLCTIDGGGHTWPGGAPVPSLGKTSYDLSATDAMWAFFELHPMP